MSNFANLLIIIHMIIRMAGPEANAEARKRGARSAVSQKGLAPRPEKIKAVTVWMLNARGIEIRTSGFNQIGGASS